MPERIKCCARDCIERRGLVASFEYDDDVSDSIHHAVLPMKISKQSSASDLPPSRPKAIDRKDLAALNGARRPFIGLSSHTNQSLSFLAPTFKPITIHHSHTESVRLASSLILTATSLNSSATDGVLRKQRPINNPSFPPTDATQWSTVTTHSSTTNRCRQL